MRCPLSSILTALGVLVLVDAPFAPAVTADGAVQRQGLPRPIVTIDPSCPVLPLAPIPAGEQKPIPVLVRYDPAAPGAKLLKPQSLSIELAFNGRNWRDNQRTVQMTRHADGTWEATIPVLRHWHLVVFYVKGDGDSIDNNGGKYWEFLGCGPDGTPTMQAVENLAATYVGDVLAPGIARAVDYGRAISLLQEDIKRHPDRIGHLHVVWNYRVKQEGGTSALYAELADEIGRLLAERKGDKVAVITASRLAWTWRERLPAPLVEQARAALVALDPESAFVADMEFSSIRSEKDSRRRAALYADFLKRHPDDSFTQSALAERFLTLSREVNDVAAAEEAFEDWRQFEPDALDVYASLGSYYVLQKTKPDKAVALLTKAIDLCGADVKRPPARLGPTFRVTVGCSPPDQSRPAPGLARLEQDVAKLRHFRAQALMQQGENDPAIADLEFAARVFPDDGKIAFALGQACERVGRKDAAYAAYLRAATAPHQTSREPAEALERLFVKGGLGTKEELDSRVEAVSVARRKKIASDFKPVLLDRPAPSFSLTTLDGQHIDNGSLVGRPVVLNFWATWCGPCVAEMPGIVDFQRRHPEVTVVAVAMWSEAADVPPMVQKRKWDPLTVAISDATGVAFGVNAVPQTVILDKAGRIRFIHSGELEDVVAVLEKELALLKTLGAASSQRLPRSLPGVNAVTPRTR